MKCQDNSNEPRACQFFRAGCFFRGCCHPKCWGKIETLKLTTIRPMQHYDNPKNETDNPPDWCPVLVSEGDDNE